MQQRCKSHKYWTEGSGAKHAVTNAFLEKLKLKSKLKSIHSFTTFLTCSGSHYGARPSMCRAKSSDSAFKEHFIVCLHNRSPTVTQQQKSSNMNHILCKNNILFWVLKLILDHGNSSWQNDFTTKFPLVTALDLSVAQLSWNCRCRCKCPFCGFPQLKTFCLVSTTVIVRHLFNYSSAKIWVPFN